MNSTGEMGFMAIGGHESTKSIRLLALPDDLEPLSDIAAETVQYPEHPEERLQAVYRRVAGCQTGLTEINVNPSEYNLRSNP